MKLLTFVFSPLLYLVSYFYPKKKKLWLYGAWFGQRFDDNSKIFFEYANTRKGVEHYWIYKNKNVKNLVEEEGYKSAYAYSAKGILLQLRAKTFITCINSSDFIPFLVTPRNYFVQLWHGSPIKHIGINSRKSSLRKFIDSIRFKTIDRYSLMISPSLLIDKNYKKAFNLKDKVILRCGYPRNEKLILEDSVKEKIRSDYQVKENETLFAYLPTHRKEGKGENPFVTVLKNMISNNDFLKEKGIKILVKPHFYEKESLNHISESSQVLIRYDLSTDLYSLLGATDGLITDYSSVIFDYELLNKKIVVYPFDYDNYIKEDRDLYYDFSFIYENVNNVTKVSGIPELMKALTSKEAKNTALKEISTFNVPMGSYSEKIYNHIIKKLGL